VCVVVWSLAAPTALLTVETRSQSEELHAFVDSDKEDVVESQAAAGEPEPEEGAAAMDAEAAAEQEAAAVSHSCACIGLPCLRHCVHGASIGGGGGAGFDGAGGGRESPLVCRAGG
jgi:hypothetical protein